MISDRMKITKDKINILFCDKIDKNLISKINKKISIDDILICFLSGNISKETILNYEQIKCIKYFILNKEQLKFASNEKANINYEYEINWIEFQHLFISFIFENASQITLMQGGVDDSMIKWKDIENNIKICFVKNWETEYDGRFGYIVSSLKSNNTQDIIFYNYGCALNLNSKNKPFIQEIHQTGIKNILFL